MSSEMLKVLQLEAWAERELRRFYGRHPDMRPKRLPNWTFGQPRKSSEGARCG